MPKQSRTTPPVCYQLFDNIDGMHHATCVLPIISATLTNASVDLQSFRNRRSPLIVLDIGVCVGTGGKGAYAVFDDQINKANTHGVVVCAVGDDRGSRFEQRL